MKKAKTIQELTTLLNHAETVKNTILDGVTDEFMFKNKDLNLKCYATVSGEKTTFTLLKPFRQYSIRNLVLPANVKLDDLKLID
jgi:hypothetical protein